MKELSVNELDLVVGGEDKGLAGAANEYSKPILWGAVLGEARNYPTLSSIKGWRAGGLAGLGVGLSGELGYSAGSWIYNNSETVRNTAFGMVESFDLRYLGGRLGGRNNNNKSCNCGSVCHCSSND